MWLSDTNSKEGIFLNIVFIFSIKTIFVSLLYKYFNNGEEISKIKTIPVSEEELHNAKNNLIGKQQFLSETNLQQASIMAYYSIMGKPFNYRDIVIEKIKKATSEDILNCAQKYFTDDYVLSVLKP